MWKLGGDPFHRHQRHKRASPGPARRTGPLPGREGQRYPPRLQRAGWEESGAKPPGKRGLNWGAEGLTGFSAGKCSERRLLRGLKAEEPRQGTDLRTNPNPKHPTYTGTSGFTWGWKGQVLRCQVSSHSKAPEVCVMEQAQQEFTRKADVSPAAVERSLGAPRFPFRNQLRTRGLRGRASGEAGRGVGLRAGAGRA